MRLLYTSWFGDLGGGELRLLDHLRATAFAARDGVVLVGQVGPLPGEIRRLGFEARTICWSGGTGFLARQLHWYRAKLATWRAMRAHRPDVVVCNTFFDFDTSGRVAAALGLPLVWRARADTFPYAHDWAPGRLQALVDLLNRRVHRILATTDYEAQMMLRAGVREDKVFVVRNGVDLPTYDRAEGAEAIRAACGAADLIVSFVARMVPQKGYEVFFDALARARQRGVNVKALVAGDTTLLEDSPDAYRRQLRARVIDLGLGDAVRFLGFRRDVAAVMAASDVFVLASLKEPFGTTVIEAMAARRAVIASDLPGPRESIVEDRTGWFFPAGDADALAERLLRAAASPAQCRVLGAAGRERAEREFDLGRNIATLDRHCLEVAGGGRVAGSAAPAVA